MGFMRGFRALDTRDPTNPYFQQADAQGQPGMDAKFVFRDHFTVDVTANPDFSQVESEDPQITVNQRYAVYFPEKRPFFLENEDFFRTPMDLLFTRSIGDPSAGIRLTGKDGPYSVGVMATDDRSPGLAVPDYSQFSGMRSYFTIARVSRDIFGQSSVGALYTDWECPTTGEFNRIGGVDTHLKFNPNWTLDGQAVTSSSNLNLNCEANTLSIQFGESRAMGDHYAGRRRRWSCGATGCISPTTERTTTSLQGSSRFQDSSIAWTSARRCRWPITGFVQREGGSWTGGRRSTCATISTIPGCGWIRIICLFVDSGAGTDDHCVEAVRGISGAAASAGFLLLWICVYCPTMCLGNQDYHEHRSGATVQTGYFKWATLDASYYWGDGTILSQSPASAAAATVYNQPFLAHEDNARLA